MFETIYCEHCGLAMHSMEVNLSSMRHECFCGFVLSSFGDGYWKSVDRGKRRHLTRLEEELSAFSDVSDDILRQEKDYLQEVLYDILDFFFAERSHVNRMLQMGSKLDWTEEQKYSLTPFGEEIFKSYPSCIEPYLWAVPNEFRSAIGVD